MMGVAVLIPEADQEALVALAAGVLEAIPDKVEIQAQTVMQDLLVLQDLAAEAVNQEMQVRTETQGMPEQVIILVKVVELEIQELLVMLELVVLQVQEQELVEKVELAVVAHQEMQIIRSFLL